MPASRVLLGLAAAGLLVALILLAVRYGKPLAARYLRLDQEPDVPLALARARELYRKGEAARAIRAASQIRPGSPHEAEALTLIGLAFASLEETGPARLALERAWRIQPNTEAAKVLAAIYLSCSENERGLQMLIEAAHLDPSDFRPWYAMGESVYLPLRRYDLAIQAFHDALNRRPGHAESRIGLAEALLRTHQVEEASSLLAELVKERPDDPRVLTLAAEAALESGRDDEAARRVAAALSANPDHHDALLLHARLLFRRKERREALRQVERAVSLEPSNLATLTLLGSVQSSLGLEVQAAQTQERKRQVEQRGERMERLQKQILEDPGNPELRFQLGQLAVEAGLTPLAVQAFQAALALSPGFTPARQALLELGVPAGRLPAPPAQRDEPRAR